MTPVLVENDERPLLVSDVPKVDTVPDDVPLRTLKVAPGSGDRRRTVTCWGEETTLNIADPWRASVGLGVGLG
jgi:hypothetical protein